MFSVYVGLIVFSILGTAASVFLKIDPGPVAKIAGLALILSGALCIAATIGRWPRIAFLVVFSALAELVGLHTGLPFGRYEYTAAWWPTIPAGGNHVFPLLLPFAWLMIVGGAWTVVRQKLSGAPAVLATATIAAVIDAPMERVMTDIFRYWKWNEPGPVFGAPVLNSFGWFLVALVGAISLESGAERPNPKWGAGVVGLFCAFAGISGLFRFFDPAFLILVFIGIGFLLAGRQQRNVR